VGFYSEDGLGVEEGVGHPDEGQTVDHRQVDGHEGPEVVACEERVEVLHMTIIFSNRLRYDAFDCHLLKLPPTALPPLSTSLPNSHSLSHCPLVEGEWRLFCGVLESKMKQIALLLLLDNFQKYHLFKIPLLYCSRRPNNVFACF
jgi:hypothetical protein